MIYPYNFEQKTGFDKVRLLISEKCLSTLGKELVDEMSFLNNETFATNYFRYCKIFASFG